MRGFWIWGALFLPSYFFWNIAEWSAFWAWNSWQLPKNLFHHSVIGAHSPLDAPKRKCPSAAPRDGVRTHLTTWFCKSSIFLKSNLFYFTWKYEFEEKGRDREAEICHLLVHSSNCYNGQSLKDRRGWQIGGLLWGLSHGHRSPML